MVNVAASRRSNQRTSYVFPYQSNWTFKALWLTENKQAKNLLEIAQQTRTIENKPVNQQTIVTELALELVIALQTTAASLRVINGIRSRELDIKDAVYLDKILREKCSSFIQLASQLPRRDKIAILQRALELFDLSTSAHSKRTARLAQALGQTLNLPENQIMGLFAAGSVHDIGKIGISKFLLHRNGKPSTTELFRLHDHLLIGVRFLTLISLKDQARVIIFNHLPTASYPTGLNTRVKDMPFPAKVLAVADIFDALTDDRPGRPARSAREAIANMQGDARDKWQDEEALEIISVLKRPEMLYKHRALHT